MVQRFSINKCFQKIWSFFSQQLVLIILYDRQPSKLFVCTYLTTLTLLLFVLISDYVAKKRLDFQGFIFLI